MERRDAVRVRRAAPGDGDAIAALYRRCYSSAARPDCTRNYPFPQVMEPEWIRTALRDGTVIWMVADDAGRVAGAVALYLGDDEEPAPAPEYFGLVVDPACRGRSLGAALLGALSTAMAETGAFAVGQVRLAGPAATSVVERSPLRVLGFEPLAYDMIGGQESMIAVGHVSAAALAMRVPSQGGTAAVRRLARLVLGQTSVRDAPPACGRPALTVRDLRRHLRVVDGETFATARDRLGPGALPLLRLGRLEALDERGPRPVDAFHAIGRGTTPTAAIWTRTDHLDRRVRILDVVSPTLGSAAQMLCSLLATMKRTKGAGRPLSAVADVEAGRGDVGHLLESVGFRPTVFYPAMLARDGQRLDVVQYTFLEQGAPTSVRTLVARCPWELARRVAMHVLDGWAPPLVPRLTRRLTSTQSSSAETSVASMTMLAAASPRRRVPTRRLGPRRES
jgi:ribosomal protein S18 acetylase RimI-like enzyme